MEFNGTIAPGGTIEILSDNGIDVRGADLVSWLVSNLSLAGGSVDTHSVYWSMDSAGEKWSPPDPVLVLAAPVGPLGSVTFTRAPVGAARMRLVLTSILGCNVRCNLISKGATP